jgi:hypothetical protein
MREVRPGLVCYGGVSVAIYMHGVTKELYKLVRAARAFERAFGTNDFDAAKWLTGAPDVQAPRTTTVSARISTRSSRSRTRMIRSPSSTWPCPAWTA